MRRDSRLGVALLGALVLGSAAGDLSASFSSGGAGGASFTPYITVDVHGAATASFDPISFRSDGVSRSIWNGHIQTAYLSATLGSARLGALQLGKPSPVPLSAHMSIAGAGGASFTPEVTVQSDGQSSAVFVAVTLKFEQDGSGGGRFVPSIAAPGAAARLTAIPGLAQPGAMELGRPIPFSIPPITFSCNGGGQARFTVGVEGSFECDGRITITWAPTYDGSTFGEFRCDGSAGGAASSDASGSIWRGVWSSTQSYAVGDVVTYNGQTYKAILGSAPSSPQEPDTSPTYWQPAGGTGTAGGTQTGTTFTASVPILGGSFECDGGSSAYFIGRYYGVRISCILGSGGGASPPPVTFVGPVFLGGSAY